MKDRINQYRIEHNIRRKQTFSTHKKAKNAKWSSARAVPYLSMWRAGFRVANWAVAQGPP